MKRHLLRTVGIVALRWPFYLTVGGVAAWAFDKLILHGFLGAR